MLLGFLKESGSGRKQMNYETFPVITRLLNTPTSSLLFSRSTSFGWSSTVHSIEFHLAPDHDG
jgi:hypothetical protein